MKLETVIVVKIWNWTDEDVNALFKPFIVSREAGKGGNGPTNGYAIFLFSMMDLWGSIFKSRFNVRNKNRENIADFLKRLKTQNADMYDFGSLALDTVADELRNNVIHNYGLRVVSTGNLREWLNIDINSNQQIINIQNTDDRWHIDCLRLKDDMLSVIEGWLIQNNYIHERERKYV